MIKLKGGTVGHLHLTKLYFVTDGWREDRVLLSSPVGGPIVLPALRDSHSDYSFYCLLFPSFLVLYFTSSLPERAFVDRTNILKAAILFDSLPNAQEQKADESDKVIVDSRNASHLPNCPHQNM